MDRNTCPNCGADLRDVGVCEYGLCTFEYLQSWNPTLQVFEGFEAEPRYGDCTFISQRCPRCWRDLGFDPNDYDDE